MTTITDADLAEVRERAYRLGRTLVTSAANEHGAYVRAGTLTRKWPESGLVFAPGEVEIPEALLSALDLEPGERWGVYATPNPLLTRGQVWDDETADALLDRLRDWGDIVLVRAFKDSSSASTTAHRDNTKTLATWTRLSGVRFRSQIIGTPGSASALFGEFAYREDAGE